MQTSVSSRDYIDQIEPLQSLLQTANHVDVKTIESDVALRQFIAGFMNYMPIWVKALYGVRMVFVRFLGMKQARIPPAPQITPETVPMTPGQNAAFFTVRHAQEDRYWKVDVVDDHLTAGLAIVAEPIDDNRTRFHVVTIVQYHKWSGPVYFNVIRPFHHLVVGGMTRAGAKSA